MKKKAQKKVQKKESKPKAAGIGIRRTYVTFILDDSGSMRSIRDAAITHFNEQVENIRAEMGTIDAKVNLTVFSSASEFPLFNKGMNEMVQLTKDNYLADGPSTALYDAVGQTIAKIKAEIGDWDAKSVSHLFVVVTDGEENSSTEYSADGIADMIQELQKNRWTFTYMGANQNLAKLKEKLRIPAGNIMSYPATSRGIKMTGPATKRGFGRYFASMSSASLSTSNCTVDNFYRDPQKKTQVL